MFSFVQSWFSSGANPVGVDFGTHWLRLAQIDQSNGDCRLVAAASALVPPEIAGDESARFDFLTAKLRELWVSGNFRGRRAVLALPAAGMYVQHIRLPRMDDESIRKALMWESQGKLPIDLSEAALRHLVAGNVYHDQQPHSEVILLAARKKLVDGMLSAVARARFDVVGMTVEPRALIDCFLHIYRRKSDADTVNCFVDIGTATSRAVISRGGHILFARNLAVGTRHFDLDAAAATNIVLEERRESGIELESLERSHDAVPIAHANRANDNDGAVAVMDATSTQRATEDRAEAGISDPTAKLVEELSLCRRYHESAFPESPVERLIFVGGGANRRELCQQVARQLEIAAQIGDPLVRMGRTTDVGIESGIDRRAAQPGWAVAIGLSMGSMGSELQ